MTREIMSKPLPGETPNSRLRQLGMMNLLYSLQKADTALTITTVTELTGMTRKAAQETLDPLVARGLLLESWGRTSLGRGKARQYQIAPEIFDKLQGVYGA
ncbi:MarR family transcriptional regulator [Aquamicrobium sp. LC103]|uniref:MarR family transcriptional regulator n=1 Tax=Aquamicrobium sp. LC103 TaxID=1120658 RepID=UPI001FEEB90B|nr:MarR family transcriptional regulator [Aquamicrobium sp. LC103]